MTALPLSSEHTHLKQAKCDHIKSLRAAFILSMTGQTASCGSILASGRSEQRVIAPAQFTFHFSGRTNRSRWVWTILGHGGKARFVCIQRLAASPQRIYSDKAERNLLSSSWAAMFPANSLATSRDHRVSLHPPAQVVCSTALLSLTFGAHDLK